MKGVSVTVIGSVVLALVGVTVMIGLFTDLSPLDSESGFCGVYNSLNPSLPDSVTPTVAGCSEEANINYEKVDTSDPDEFSLKLAVGVQECWDEFRGYNVDFRRCEAWSVPELDEAVDESYLNQKMSENSICPELIQNSDLEFSTTDPSSSNVCGSENQIRFRLDEIKESSFILVGYNSTGSGFVEVK